MFSPCACHSSTISSPGMPIITASVSIIDTHPYTNRCGTLVHPRFAQNIRNSPFESMYVATRKSSRDEPSACSGTSDAAASSGTASAALSRGSDATCDAPLSGFTSSTGASTGGSRRGLRACTYEWTYILHAHKQYGMYVRFASDATGSTFAMGDFRFPIRLDDI